MHMYEHKAVYCQYDDDDGDGDDDQRLRGKKFQSNFMVNTEHRTLMVFLCSFTCCSTTIFICKYLISDDEVT